MAERLAPTPVVPTASFAALTLAEPIERIGGGYETDVFRTGDGRLALKLKHQAGAPAAMLARARRLKQVADLFRAYLGPDHSLPSEYLVVAGAAGQGQILAVQPFLADAHALDSIDLATLSPRDRAALAGQLQPLIAGALACYRATGYLPDLYGLGPHAGAMARRWDLRWIVREGWRILTGRPLITAHNLLLTGDGRVVLVDYDPICDRWPSCGLVYGTRAILLRRDRGQVAALAAER